MNDAHYRFLLLQRVRRGVERFQALFRGYRVRRVRFMHDACTTSRTCSQRFWRLRDAKGHVDAERVARLRRSTSAAAALLRSERACARALALFVRSPRALTVSDA